MTHLPRMNCFTFLAAGLIAIVPGCSKSSDSQEQSDTQDQQSSTDTAPAPLSVYTTFYPTTYFAQRIGGSHVEVTCPLPDDADPIFWQPHRDTIMAYQQADLIILNGADFEKWVQTASLPAARIVDTARNVTDQFITYESVTHSHGPGGEHTHEGIDGHTWVDPTLAIAQVREIESALIARRPEAESDFTRNADALRADLQALDARFQKLIPAMSSGVTILASHPAYNYPAHRYGWPIINLDLDPEAPLTETVLADIQAHADGSDILLLWESAPLEETALTLRAEFGIHNVLFSPCEMLSVTEQAAGADYLSVMNGNLDRLQEALAEISG